MQTFSINLGDEKAVSLTKSTFIAQFLSNTVSLGMRGAGFCRSVRGRKLAVASGFKVVGWVNLVLATIIVLFSFTSTTVAQQEILNPQSNAITLEHFFGLLDEDQKEEFRSELSLLIWSSRCDDVCDEVPFLDHLDVYEVVFLSSSGKILGRDDAPELSEFILRTLNSAVPNSHFGYSDAQPEDLIGPMEMPEKAATGEIRIELSSFSDVNHSSAAKFCRPNLKIEDGILQSASVRIWVGKLAFLNCVARAVSPIIGYEELEATSAVHQPLIQVYQTATFRILAQIRKLEKRNVNENDLSNAIQRMFKEIEEK